VAPVEFITVDVEPGECAPSGVQLRFKRAGVSEPISEIEYESERGLSGRWSVFSANGPNDVGTECATRTPVEDSGDGTVWLVSGGSGGLVLVHLETGTREREPYLVLRRP
jgi:hypothetical protein